MKRILIVEDSHMIAAAIRREIFSKLNLKCDVAGNLEEAKKCIGENGKHYFVAVLDLNLPDAQEGEIVDYVRETNIPCIIFTGSYDDELREKMMGDNILDYVVKEGTQAVERLLHVIYRIYKNQSIKVMVVDDSSTSRANIVDLLHSQRYQTLQAKNGKEALIHLQQNPDVKMVITDYNMPVMDGFQLITRIREKYSREKMAIIGLSAYGTGTLSAKFLKKGANDFIIKPFVEEEFRSRINQNIEMLEYIEEIKNASNKDYLTGLYNRRYLYEFGQKLFENALRSNFSMCAAILDIDFFKKVNDTYGHLAGDVVLKHVGKLLEDNLRTADVVARTGGEEFCIFTTNMPQKKAEVLFERLRKLVEKQKIQTETDTISVTVSVGVTTKIANSLEATINYADQLLYKAKNTGRNKVVID